MFPKTYDKAVYDYVENATNVKLIVNAVYTFSIVETLVLSKIFIYIGGNYDQCK